MVDSSNRFSTRDIVFAALMAVLTLVVTSLLIPISFAIRLPGTANVATAWVMNALLMPALLRLRRPGSILLIYGTYALIALLISPLITGFVLTGALVAEAVVKLVFGDFSERRARWVGGTVLQLTMMPASMGLSYFFFPERFVVARWWAWLLAGAAILASSLVGCRLGDKLAKELVAAGKITPPSPPGSQSPADPTT